MPPKRTGTAGKGKGRGAKLPPSPPSPRSSSDKDEDIAGDITVALESPENEDSVVPVATAGASQKGKKGRGGKKDKPSSTEAAMEVEATESAPEEPENVDDKVKAAGKKPEAEKKKAGKGRGKKVVEKPSDLEEAEDVAENIEQKVKGRKGKGAVKKVNEPVEEPEKESSSQEEDDKKSSPGRKRKAGKKESAKEEDVYEFDADTNGEHEPATEKSGKKGRGKRPETLKESSNSRKAAVEGTRVNPRRGCKVPVGYDEVVDKVSAALVEKMEDEDISTRNKEDLKENGNNIEVDDEVEAPSKRSKKVSKAQKPKTVEAVGTAVAAEGKSKKKK